jgi:hypothetical protein
MPISGIFYLTCSLYHIYLECEREHACVKNCIIHVCLLFVSIPFMVRLLTIYPARTLFIKIGA